jgi:transcription-repair coupling factor (superfamily II helicase)
MSSTQLEDTMSAFYDRQYDLLIATNIIESGIDIPTANTLIVHRCDLFGLAQLYQLRGRVGRSKAQGYAYLTFEQSHKLSDVTKRRLEILSSLDALGSGFSLASHDLDLRGAGNVVGEEQSGHIREVGVELYQKLLQEAILMARAAEGGEVIDIDEDWSPQINMGTAVLIPDSYVADLNLRLTLYRRIGHLKDIDELDDMRQELIDRFGPIPQEVRNLFDVIGLKALCKKAHVERLDVGNKGFVIGFKNNVFPKPDDLVLYLQRAGHVKLRPDQRVAFTRAWKTTKERLMDIRAVLSDLGNI